jgi:mono/diheme cytochrome c family protein
VEHNENSLLWAMDNWMYTSEGDTYFRLKDGKIETRRTLSRGQWGATQDDFGRVYRNSNSSALSIDFVPTPYYTRNPNLVRMRGSYEFMGDPDELNATYPTRPNRGVNRGYQTGQLRSDGTLATYTAVNSPIVYRGDRLPAELRGNVFVAEPSGNLVSRIVVTDDGTTLRGKKAYANAEFLTSTDERFRPVYLSSAPDGTIYVVDIYHGIIQEKGFITEYLRDHIVAGKLEAPIHMGRIYRIVHDTTRRDGPPAMAAESAAQLVAHLSHPNGWWRDTAQRLLVERHAVSVAGELKRLAETAPDPRTRVHAMWTLDGLDRLETSTVLKALDAQSRDVRAAGVRLSERWLAEPNAGIETAVLKRLDDPDWAVRQQLAASLGTLPKGPREKALSTLLARRGDDPIVADAALSGLRGGELAVLDDVLKEPTMSAPREAAVVLLTATLVRSAQDAAIQTIFARAAESTLPTWQRAALLRGGEVSLLGIAPTGNPTGRGNRAGGGGRGGDPTAPGGRAGPGGAPAFPREGAPGGAGRAGAAVAAEEGGAPAPARGGGGRGGGGNLLRLNREPAPLRALADGGGEFGPRATALLARIEWPGKPGASAPVPALTPDEQQRFTAGQAVYEGICQACHQDDGRGKDTVAPSLVGSALATGPASNPIRILMNGKEGPIGLMPPLGQSFTDDQVAAVLTYVRRQWGNAAAPVDVQAVKAVRAEVAGRKTPWTNDELAALAGGAR